MKRAILAAAVAALSLVGFGGTMRQSVITVSGYAGSETLTDFPVLVRLSPTTVSGFSYADCAADGRDIRFATTDGTPLPFEVDTWNPGGESCFWVKLPALEKDTAFVLSYGVTSAPKAPAGNIWAASGYEAVWHLGEPRYWAYNASTNDWFTGLPAGDGATLMVGQPGLIGTGRCLGTTNGAKSYLNFEDYMANGLNLGSTFTFSGWYYVTAQRGSSQWTRLAARANNAGAGADGWGIQLDQKTTSLTVHTSYSGDDTTATFDDIVNRWAHFSFVFGGTSLTIYVDGEAKTSNTISGVNQTKTARPLCIGNSDGGQDAWLAGTLDEVRLSSVARSADWTKAEYDTVMTTGFLVCGAVAPVAPSTLAMNQTLYLTSSAFGSSEVAVLVTGVGAEPATLTFEYGPSSDALEHTSVQTVTAAGEYGVTLPRLAAGQAYCVKATLSAGGTSIASDVFSFVQPEVTEEGRNPRLRADLPKGYVQMEKLVSTGKQCVRTKIVPTPTSSVELEFGECQSAAVASSIFGQGWGDNYYMLDTQSGKNNFFFHGTGTTDLQMPINAAHDYRVTVEPNLLKAKYAELVIADVTAPAATTTEVSVAVQANRVWSFFGAQDKTDKFSTYSFYSFKSWDNGVLTGDFVPVWSVDRRESGLYDFVTQEFYGNVQSGGLFARQPQAKDVALLSANGRLVVTVPVSDADQTVYVCSDESYCGVDGWTTSEPIEIPAGETTASVGLPSGWGETVFYARARLGSGADVVWSKTVVAQEQTEAIGIGAKLARASSTLDTSDISAVVSGLGSGATEATLVFKYGTASDALDREAVVTGISTPGDWCGTLKNLQLGATYYVQATLTNDVGGSVSSDVFSFVQPTPEGMSELRPIPDGYEPVASVGLDGATYLTTEIYPSRSTRAVVSYMSLDSAHDKMIFGERYGDYPFLLWCGNTGGLLLSPICGSSSASALPYGVSGNTAIKYGDIVTVDFGLGGVYYSVNGGDMVVLDSAETVAGQAVDKTASYPLVLFGMYQNGSIESRKFFGNCYWFKLYEGEELVHDYVPMRETTGEKRVVLWDYAKGEASLPTAGVYTVGEGECPPVVRIENEPVSSVDGVSPALGAYLGAAGSTYLFSAPTGTLMGAAVCTLTGYSVYEQTDSGETCVKEGSDTMFAYTLGSRDIRVVWHWSLSGPPAFSSDPVDESHAFGSTVVSIEVAGLGSASEATLAFAYGTEEGVFDGSVSTTVTAPGVWSVTLPHLIAGRTYYVKAMLDNHDADPVTSATASFTQPVVAEEGGDPRIRPLPDGYVQMEKLVGTGSEYIQTDFLPGNTTATEFEFGEVTYVNKTAFFGQGWNNGMYLFNMQSDNFYFHGSGTVNLGLAVQGGCDYSVKIEPTTGGNGTLTLIKKSIPEAPISPTVSLTCDGSKNLAIFASNGGGNKSKYSLYSLKFWKAGELAADYVPAYEVSTDTAGLYDLKGRKFYSSTATETAFERQAAVKKPAIKIVDGRIVATILSSEAPRTAVLCWGETYAGVGTWEGVSEESVEVPAGATSVSFPKPAGWGSSVFFARVRMDGGEAAVWTPTLIWERADLGVETPTRVSSAFGSAVVAAEVTGLGKTASEATLTFSYGTTLDASEYSVSVTVTDIGEWRGTLPHLIGGQTYYVKATLDNHVDTPVESDALPLAQPESDERLLPVGYTKVEYVESNGKQYVDTGVDGKSGLECRTKMMWVSSNSDKTYLGARNSSDRIYLLHSYGGWCYGYGGYVNKGTIVNDRAYDVHSKLFPSEQFVEVDGAKVVTGTSASSIDVSRTLYLFAMNSSGSQGASSSARCYSLQIWEQGVLTRDYVPCYSDADKTYGLYDLANGVFSKSATTTALLGPAVSADDRGIRVLSLDTASATLAIAGKATDSTLYRVDGVIGGGEDVAAWGSVTDLGTVAASDAPVERTAALNAGWGESVWMTRFFLVTGSTTNWSDTVIWQDTSKPVVDAIAADGVGGDRIVVTGHLESFPGESCRLYAVVSKSEDVLANPIAGADSGEVTVDAAGDFTLTLNDATDALFVPGSVRYVQVMAVANGKTGASPVAEVRLAGKPVFGTATASISRRTITVTGSLADLGVKPPQTVELWAGDAGALAKVAETTVDTAGESFTLTYAYPLFEHTYQWQLRVSAETANGSPLDGDPTPAANATTLDTTTYKWTGNGENNSWTNSVNWDDGVKGDSLGFPQTTAATAQFTKNADVEIDLPSTKTCKLDLNTAGIDVRFHSADTNRFGLVLDGLSMTKNIRWTLDHACVRRASDISWPAGVTIVLTNAANLYINNNTMTAGGVTMILADESYLSCYTVYLGNGSTNIINNSTFYTRYDDNLGNKAGEALVRFEGTHPLWWHNGKDRYFYSGLATTAMHFDFLVPEEGYAAAPIQCISTNTKLAGNNNNTKGAGSLTVNVLDESPLAFVRGEHEVPLISWPKSGINTAAFITNNVPHEVPGSEFIWGEGTSPKTLSAKITGYVSSNFILVKSNDEEYNPEGFNADSGYGKHSLVDGAQVTLAAPTSYFNLADDERVYIVGWELWSKLDDDSDEMTLVRSSANPGDGEDDRTCKYKHEHYSEFVWLWRHQKRVKVTVAGSGHGVVAQDVQWVDAGAASQVLAIPDEGYAVAWTAGVANERMFENPLVIDETVEPWDITVEFFQPSANEGEKTGLFATYAHSTPITFSGYDGESTLTNFPALIRLGDGDGGFSYADCSFADGRDVRFCDVAGNELDSEIAKFDANGTSEFWVRVPVLKGRQTRIFAVWGNGNPTPRNVSAQVWDGDFRGVWGLGKGRNLALDSTGNDQHGVCVEENGISSVPGIVGDARRFAGLGTGNRFDLGCGNEVNLEPSEFTIECWFRVDALPSDYSYFITSQSIGDYQGGRCYTFGIDKDGVVFARPNGYYDSRANYKASSATPVVAGGWHHAAFVYSGTVATVFVDGVEGTSYTAGPFSGWGRPTARPRVAELSGDNQGKGYWRYYAGDLDEMRFSSVIRSADYLRATYLTVASNETFAVFGTEAHPSLMVDGVVQPLAPAIEVSAPESERDGVRRTCTGYAVVADGKLIESGEGASVSRTWPSNATDVAVAWNWKTEYEVSVNGATKWREAGTLLPVTAGEAPEGNAFHSWDGNCPTLEVFTASFDLPVDGPRTISAIFAPEIKVEAVGEDATENGAALVEAFTAAAARTDPVVLTIGDGDYSCSYATTFTFSNPIVVRSEHGAAATIVRQGVEKPRMFTFDNPRCAIIGLTLVSHTANSMGTPSQMQITKGHIRDCVFHGTDSWRFTNGLNYQLYQLWGWCFRCVFHDLVIDDAHDGDRPGQGKAKFERVLVDSCLVTNVYVAAGLSPFECAKETILRNCVIAKNVVKKDVKTSGGGVRVTGGGVRIENCTIADNVNSRASSAGAYGGGLYASTPVVVANTILFGNLNYTSDDGDDYYGPIAFINSLSKEMTGAEYGSSVAQAAFREDDDGTYHPRATSPSVDAGYPIAWSQSLGAKDFGGTNRVYGAAVDIGAHEYHPAGDENLDVNVAADTVTGRDTLSVNFTPTVIGAKGEVVYAWDFGDGTVETNDTGAVSHTYAHAGYYTVTLTVSDGVSPQPAVYKGTDLIKVIPSTCYINAAGSHTAPYDTREKGATTISDVIGYTPTAIIVCSNTSAEVAYSSRTIINFKADVIGEDRETSVLAGCYELNHPEARLMNVTHKYSGGAGYHHSSLFITQGLVSNIVARECRPSNTGGIVIGKDSKTVTNARLMDSFVINQNTTVRGSESGNSAIRIIGPGVIVENCVVTNCLSGTAAGSRGAGIAVDSGLDPAPVIRNSLIGYNRCFDSATKTNAVGGAGIYANGPVVVENCTIVSNQTCGTGAGIYVKAGTVEIVNTVIASNVGGMTNAAEICSNEVYVAQGASVTWTKSRVPAEAGIDDAGVTTGDPKFNFDARKSRPFWSLRSNSPCKDAGVRLDWMEGATDLIGNPRAYGIPDMGCYESQVGGTAIIVR